MLWAEWKSSPAWHEIQKVPTCFRAPLAFYSKLQNANLYNIRNSWLSRLKLKVIAYVSEISPDRSCWWPVHLCVELTFSACVCGRERPIRLYIRCKRLKGLVMTLEALEVKEAIPSARQAYILIVHYKCVVAFHCSNLSLSALIPILQALPKIASIYHNKF
jgi:hypothetical protein